MPIDSLNGELLKLNTVFNEELINSARPLPRNLHFSVDMGDESILYIIKFEKFELMDASERLGSNG